MMRLWVYVVLLAYSAVVSFCIILSIEARETRIAKMNKIKKENHTLVEQNAVMRKQLEVYWQKEEGKH